MSTETSTPRTVSMPSFERRVWMGGLLVTVPAWLLVAVLLQFGLTDVVSRGALVAAAAVVTLWLTGWHYRRVVYPINTLSGLLEALREGDYNLRGAAGGVLGDTVYDVNALASRLKSERLEFEESTHLLRKTLAALDSAVLVFGAGQRLRLLNPAARHLLETPYGPFFGQTATQLRLAELLEGPPSQVTAWTFPHRSGRFDVRRAALRSGGQAAELLVINDVGRVLRDEERQAWQRLLRVIGHEVNNSLAPIQSMAGTLATLAAREPLPGDWRDDFATGLGVIKHRAEALGRFLSSYEKLLKLPPPQPRAVELPALLARVARLEQRLPVEVEGGGPLTVLADPDQLEQALINLLCNAVEAALPTGGGVRVRWQREAVGVVIEVEDDGPGPPSSDNLFVPFFTTKPGGSGIGLALARQIAEAHGGDATLTARDAARGAIARLRLPLKAAVNFRVGSP
ncbi:MAG: sensor histidine kinase [Rhodanobacteraceae bacterium]